MNENKSNKGLIIFIIILVIVALAIVAFIVIDNDKQQNIEKAMKGPVLDYFDKYVSVNSTSSAYKITLGMLKEANENGEDYNLKPLEGCKDDETYATVVIDFSNGEVKNTEFKINCKKW